MPPPRAVVIPFGVPSDGRGLGLGLAALVHGFTRIDGQSVALAQLHARKPEATASGTKPDAAPASGPSSAKPEPVEAFVPPSAWRDLAGQGSAPIDVTLVVTGAFEPPNDGRGTFQLLAFDAKDGKTRAKVEVALDDEHAGATLCAAFDEIWALVGGELGSLRDIRDLGWDALESVLRAERCALHDPSRGGPHDRLAAMLHLGRAIGDAPRARFPAERLATIALEAAMVKAPDARLAEAALRALGRASDDAPEHVDLAEAMGALLIRLGRAREAERRLNAAIAREPKRTRLYAVLSEALRAQGNLDGALAALQAGVSEVGEDALLDTERGIVLLQRGDDASAADAWRRALARSPGHAAAFANLAALAAKHKDVGAAQSLVDMVLAAPDVDADVVRRAIHLALMSEPDGLARASRLAALAKKLVERVPDDAYAALILARAIAQLGDTSEAKKRLAFVEQAAPGSTLAAEAQRVRLTIEHPAAALEIEAALRAACTAEVADLDQISARARRLAAGHESWLAWVAAAIADRRRARWVSARDAADAAVKIAPGCAPAHAELAAALIALGETRAPLLHAERAIILEGDSPRSLGLLARALLAAGRRDDAQIVVTRALALDETDEANRTLAAMIRGENPRSKGTTKGLVARLVARLRGEPGD